MIVVNTDCKSALSGNWTTIDEEQIFKLCKDKYDKKVDKLCCVYRWIVKSKNDNIIGGYVGETSNLGLRVYEYRRVYSKESLEKYKNSTDVVVYNKINEYIKKGLTIELQKKNDLCPIQIKEKQYRLKNEREALIDLIQITRNVWNKIN